jgi:hypothetical protein
VAREMSRDMSSKIFLFDCGILAVKTTTTN